MSRHPVQIKPITGHNTNSVRVPFDRLALRNNRELKPWIRGSEGVSQSDRVVVTMAGTPDNAAVEGESTLSCMAFDRVAFWFYPDFEVVAHDYIILFIKAFSGSV